jgi:hypothetical protein
LAEQLQITLRSFLRKTLNSYILKAGIRKTGATLIRKGRSRDWILEVNNIQIQQIIELVETSDQSSWQWLVKVLKVRCQRLTQNELLNIIERNPAISLNQLVGLTNCTRSQAREVLDKFEWQ